MTMIIRFNDLFSKLIATCASRMVDNLVLLLGNRQTLSMVFLMIKLLAEQALDDARNGFTIRFSG